ncbi:unnamed protein product [Echinostoma caproni]|uniref:ANK_REP_REGION domain-containing protein n=1 Tax=Echinostoma caproni TaxID=27848 RepID=A0A183ABY0_9TREM|nr:unnamed protein product [Echinostoma caproni]
MGPPGTEDTTSYDEQLIGVLDACDRGDVKRLGEFIISGGELKDLVDSRGRNVLHHCVRREDEKVPEAPRNLFEQLDRIKCARIIVKTDSSFMSQLDAQGYSPMHLAVLDNDVEFIRAMQEFRPPMGVKTDSSDSQDASLGSKTLTGVGGRTVIHLAVLQVHIEILDLLLEMDATDCIDCLDDQGATALHYAVQLPKNVVNKVLEKMVKQGKADLNVKDAHGRTALSWAATIGAFEAVVQLLKLGAKLNITDECGLTALHCAASRGNRDIVHSMLSCISVANMDDLSKMATFRDVADNDGCTPIFYSVTMGHYEVTKCLLDYGANVQVQDSKGRTLAHCLARLGATQTVNMNANQRSDDNTQNTGNNNKDNKNILHVQMTELLEAGLNPWTTTNSGAAPLHEACLLRNVHFVRELAKLSTFKQNVDTRDAQGHTALHLVVAASWSSDSAGLELCECLLRNGANVNASTLLPQGGAVTPLDLAIMNEQEENVDHGPLRTLLEKHGAKTFQQLSGCGREDRIENSTPSMCTKKETNDADRKTPRRPVKKLLKSESVILPIPCRNMTDAAIQPINQKGSPRTHSKTVIDTEINREQKMHVVSVQTTRGSQTEFEFSPRNSSPGVGRRDVCDGTKSYKRQEVATQCEDLTSDSKIRGTVSDSTCSQTTKRSSSKLSTNSSSASVRVDTPSSSTTEAGEHEPPNRKPKLKNRMRTSPARTGITSPYTRSYLEQELPSILKRYLNNDEQMVSPLTGRSRMPKPTLSPYLIPLVPNANPMIGFSRKPGAKPTANSRSPKRKPLAARNAEHPAVRESRHKTPPPRISNASTTVSSGTCRTSSAPSSWIMHPSNRRIVDELIKQCLEDPYLDQPKRPNREKSVDSESRSRNVKPKVRRPSSHGKTRSAMGGEISPVGIREELDDMNTGTNPNMYGIRSRKSSVYQKRSGKEARSN